jgi:hypothetical protein
VQRLLASLASRGLVTVEQQGGGTAKTRDDRRPNLYRLHMNGVTPMSPGDALRGDMGVVDGVTPMSPETSSNRPVEKNPPAPTSSKKAETPLRLQSKALVAPWWEALETKPATPYIAIVKVVERCLDSGWSEDEITAALREAQVVSGPAFDVWRARRGNTRTDCTPRLLQESIEFFEGRGLVLWRHANIDRLRSAISTMLLWGYGPGETMIRLAIAARRPQDMLDPKRLASLPRVVRFSGDLDDLSRCMETAYLNLAWRGQS